MDPSEISGPDKEMRDKVPRIEGKQERGERASGSSREDAPQHARKPTKSERGAKGDANMERGAAAEEKAAREGRLGEYREEHRTASWMKDEPTRKPILTADTKEEIERIREKQEEGEKLTRSEAGILGGASRAKE